MLIRQAARHPKQTTHRIPQQVDVRGVMHVRLHHAKESQRPRNDSPGLLAGDRVAARKKEKL